MIKLGDALFKVLGQDKSDCIDDYIDNCLDLYINADYDPEVDNFFKFISNCIIKKLLSCNTDTKQLCQTLDRYIQNQGAYTLYAYMADFLD